MPRGVYERTEKIKESTAKNGFQKGCSAWNKGKSFSKESRLKMSISKTGHTAGMTGKKHTEKAKIKMSGSHKGKKMSDETKNKMKKSAHRGENNSNWKGGIFSNNPQERKRFLNARRRALKRNAIGGHTQGDWETLKAQYNWTCCGCGKSEPNTKLTEDHIIPLIKGGSDNIENIQPLCKSCNSKKYTKINFKTTKKGGENK
jgi:hypothetical protein